MELKPSEEGSRSLFGQEPNHHKGLLWCINVSEVSKVYGVSLVNCLITQPVVFKKILLVL